MARTTESINPALYEIALVKDGERVVEVTIRAVEGAELDPGHIREATQAVIRHLRPRRGAETRQRRQRETIEELHLPAHEMDALIAAHETADGRVTAEYLSSLAVAYAATARDHRDVSLKLSVALGRPLQTIKGHLMRARKEGFLSATVEGREGGEATQKAHDVLAAAGAATSTVTTSSSHSQR